jgi:hypothetical protein
MIGDTTDTLLTLHVMLPSTATVQNLYAIYLRGFTVLTIFCLRNQ